MASQPELGTKEPETATNTPIVSFLGPVSSYTHQVRTLSSFNVSLAALSCFEAGKYNYDPAASITASVLSDCGNIDVFETVQSGEAAFGVVPFENSTNGAVVFTLELLADRHNTYPDINVCEEAYLDVSHYLLGHKAPRNAVTDSPDVSGTCTPTTSIPSPLKPRTKPLSSLKHIERIYTHPQAWGQCETFLGTYLKGIERIDVSSTSRAAEMVKEDTSGTSAAIASSLAAEIHGLDILARGIEDREDNKTRFFILRKGVDEKANASTVKTKSLISFTVDHRSPGALAQVLDCFRTYTLNLTSINSRPTNVVPFQYIFFVEFEGSKLNDPDRRVEGALVSVAKLVQSWRWLGSWDDKLSR
ncbi:putative prephenate dehydratase [Lachnellula arida]|uniref:prephenate dehydratase n=1 Tax=Lachnellula arida TaxID=1316785 RepID=A0A8T9BPV5_9HELO|nr:putative prephenate dehydratase [Lachnellula arida]